MTLPGRRKDRKEAKEDYMKWKQSLDHCRRKAEFVAMDSQSIIEFPIIIPSLIKIA